MTPTEIISIEPATGAELWRGPVADLDEVLDRARRAWPGWAALPLTNRSELLRRFANELRKAADDLAPLIARETGKPLWEAQAEVAATVARVETAIASHADRTPQRKRDAGLNGVIAVRHKPHGLMAVIGPYSQPVLVPAGHIIPALLAGNVVVFKPSEKAPASGAAMLRCLHRAGIGATIAQMALGGPEMARALAMDDRVDGVLFSGSVAAGVLLNRRLAARPDRLLALEMGGNNPLVVWDTPKLADAAALVVQSAFANGGQKRTAARRLIVKATLYDEVIGAVKQLADRIVTGAPFDDPAPFMGPMIDNDAANGLTQSFIWLMSHGGHPIKHMLRPSEELPFVSPAIIDVTGVAERPDVELFGPLLQVIRVETFDEAIATANATQYGLAAGLIGGSPEQYSQFWSNIRAGIICWNRPITTDFSGTPLGGVGLSGNHRPGGLYAADTAAFPVTSAEMEQPRAMLGIGFREG